MASDKHWIIDRKRIMAAGDIQVTTVTSSGAGIGHCSPWQQWEQPAAEERVGSPGWPSMTARDDEGDVVGLRGPAELLNACLDSGQQFVYRQLSIFSDELGEPHFAILFARWVRRFGHSIGANHQEVSGI